MSLRSRLEVEKEKLDVDRKRLSRLSNSDMKETPVTPSTPNKSSTRFDYIFKIVIIGDATCGKTSLLQRYVDEVFHEQSLTTIGVDFKLKNIELEGNSVKLQIWDTAGQERFAPLGSLYYHGAHAVIITYDITSRRTFESIPRWCRKFEERDTEGIETVKVLLGCKKDLENLREVTDSQGQTAAIEIGARWGETSSKTGDNVTKIFEEIAGAIMERIRAKERKLSDPSYRPENLENGVEIITPGVTERQDSNTSSGPLQLLKRMSVKPKSFRKKVGGPKTKEECCKIS